MNTVAATPIPAYRFFQIGRPFLSPVVDLLVLGGGLSILVVGLLQWGSDVHPPASAAVLVAWGISLPWLVLFCNSAHFGASTVRLYGKPGAFVEFRFLTMALPLVTVLVAALAIALGAQVGRHVYALYLTWSPYHYAAQTYGIAVLYCFRSGCALEPRDRVLLRVACLAPFLHAFFGSPGVGLEWAVPLARLETPTVLAGRHFLVTGLAAASFVLPALAFGRVAARGGAVPLIAACAVLSNALWWTVLSYRNAFAVATIFHALQYLAIATVFHLKDCAERPDHRPRRIRPAISFYAMSFVLGYLLFNVWPYAFVAAGFGLLESTLLVAAVVNIHHFVVDGYIWRLRRSASVRAAAAA